MSDASPAPLSVSVSCLCRRVGRRGRESERAHEAHTGIPERLDETRGNHKRRVRTAWAQYSSQESKDRSVHVRPHPTDRGKGLQPRPLGLYTEDEETSHKAQGGPHTGGCRWAEMTVEHQVRPEYTQKSLSTQGQHPLRRAR